MDRLAHELARTLTPHRVAVIGAGWAGISSAVHARLAGHEVHVFEMAANPGGRARTVRVAGHALDNGQHILVGAYSATLELMRLVGADVGKLLHRTPLALQYPDGTGLRLRAGAPVRALAEAVLGRRGWSWADRLLLMTYAGRWAGRRFQCAPRLTVAQLCARLPQRVRQQLIEPLCVAALNTPADAASAQVFLRVLQDALFGAPGSADLLLPRAPLGSLLPEPAMAWFNAHDVRFNHSTRVMQLLPNGASWCVDHACFDRVILACSATEATRLVAEVAPDWARMTARLHYEPIVTVYLSCPGAHFALPMLTLNTGEEAPAQFVFDLGALGGASGIFAFVVSGAAAWVERGMQATAAAVLAQAATAFAPGSWPQPPALVHVAAEKRATFRCTPDMERPTAHVAPGLWAAADYVAGPYPATLEGAVRAGRHAARAMPSPQA